MDWTQSLETEYLTGESLAPDVEVTVTVKIKDTEITRNYRGLYDHMHNRDWNENMQGHINDVSDFIKDNK
jgi:hypothetical protein